MTVIRTADRQRLTRDNRPPGCPAFSAGTFVIRGDGTGRFDRHHHDFAEFWFVAAGAARVRIGDVDHDIIVGDLVYTPAGTVHDITGVAEQLTILWLSLDPPPGGSDGHLHREPGDVDKHPVPVISTVGGDRRG